MFISSKVEEGGAAELPDEFVKMDKHCSRFVDETLLFQVIWDWVILGLTFYTVSYFFIESGSSDRMLLNYK